MRLLRAKGWDVVATARRQERLDALAAETGCVPVAADLTRDDDVEPLVGAALAGGPIRSVVNVAGGALGVDRIEDADLGRWTAMYEKNVLTALRLTRAMIPHLRAAGGGDLLFVTSGAAYGPYAGGGGYVAAKHAERVIPQTLRLELVGEPIRIIEVAPGLTKTPEFSLNRLGSAQAAEKVYAGVAEPLTGHDVAAAIAFTLEAPPHVNIDLLRIQPVAQATNWLTARTT